VASVKLARHSVLRLAVCGLALCGFLTIFPIARPDFKFTKNLSYEARCPNGARPVLVAGQ
jgi:hypothetical protein